MRPTQLLGIALLALGATGLLWYFLKNGPQQNAMHAREIATRGLAEYLAKKFPGQRAIVLSNPFSQHADAAPEIKEAEAAGIRGLRKGFENKITLAAIAYPELKPEAEKDPRAVFIDPATTTPLSFLVAENSFDKASREHPGTEIIVSLIGMPAELDKVEIWKASGPPAFALLWPDLRLIGDATALKTAMASGKLAAFVLHKPKGIEDAVRPEHDFNTEFESRFLLVTPDNVEKMLEIYSGLF